MRLLIHRMVPTLQAGGFPHSETCGSLLTYSSPQRFAVSRVLHRLPVPRHPPCTLTSLTFVCFYDVTIQFSKIYY